MKFLGIILCTLLTIGIVPLQYYFEPLQIPPIIQKAYAGINSNLFVSAENSQYNNYFAGPQVVQVIVSDPNIDRLDQKYGEPVVTVNGKRLRMVQATDSNWYGYFADRNQAEIAGNTAPVSGKGLNFGGFCATGSATINGIDFGGQSKGFTVANGGFGSKSRISNAAPLSIGAINTLCTDTPGGTVSQEHVVRENKTLNTNPNGADYQPDLIAAWPVIQLFDFSAIPTPVTVDYQAAGGDQVVNLTFDRIPSNLISVIPDRSAYPENSQVFLTMNDPQLNIDPTEEDSWTWGSNAQNNTLYYEAFNRNGGTDADGSAAMQNLVGNLTSMMFNHNGKFTFNPSAQGVRVVDFQSNGKQVLNGSSSTRANPANVNTTSIGVGSQPITFIEGGGVNTGVFVNWDGSKRSDVVTTDLNIRGQSATFSYNDVSGSIVGGFVFGSITMTATNGTWASGQRIPVILADMDANKNSKLTEQLNDYVDSADRITTMKIGTPFTLSKSNAMFFSSGPIPFMSNGVSVMGPLASSHAAANDKSQDESFSGRPVYWVATPFTIQNTGGFVIDLNTTMQSLRNTIHSTSVGNPENFKGFNFLNLDLRSLDTSGTITKVNVYLAHRADNILQNNNIPAATQLVSISNTTSLQDFINLNETDGKIADPALVDKNLFAIPSTDDIGLVFQFSTTGNVILAANVGHPIVTDFFSIGLIGDGITKTQRINNAIYRWELQETGDNTGIFTGSSQYVLLNQLNIFDPNTYSVLRTIDQNVNFAAISDMLQSNGQAPQITYLDLGADGVNTQVSAQQDVKTHTGSVLFDKTQYNAGDTATVTLNDPDLSNGNLVSIYTAVPSGTDLAADTIGKSGLGPYFDGSPFGDLLQIKINGVNWANLGCFGSMTMTGKGYPVGLQDSGFALVETAVGTGIFQGTFTVPDSYCIDSNITSSTVGTDLQAEYVDFSDDNGQREVITSKAGLNNNVQVPEQYHIYLKTVNFVPTAGIDIPAIQGNLNQKDRVHFLLQFTKTLTLSDRILLAKNNIALTDYVTGNTYIASARVSDLNNLNNINFTRWAGPFNPDLKLSPVVKAKDLRIIPEWAVEKTQVVVTAILNKDANMTDTINRIKQLGGTVEASVALVPSITAFFDLDKVAAVANIDDVQFVDIADPPLVPQDNDARKATNIIPLENSQYNLNGSNVSVLLVDGGTVYPHEDFGNSVNRLWSDPNVPYEWHATHMAGILLGGDGSLFHRNSMVQCNNCPSNIDHSWKGMIPGASILSYGFENSAHQLPDFTDNTIFTNLFQPHISDADLSSMSVAMQIDSATTSQWLGKYTSSAMAIDTLVDRLNGQGLVLFEAVGNNRENGAPFGDFWTIDPPATAKDSIAVGAIGSNDLATLDLSSYGPTGNNSYTESGRLKPDITAPGCSVGNTKIGSMISTSYDNWQPDYASDCGTSEATPVAAGVGALLIQKWKSPSGSTVPLPSTVKAILIHTATDLGNPGPDYKYGWGAVNGRAAVDLVDDFQHNNGPQIKQSSFTSPSQTQFTFPSDGNHQVKATLVWDDPPGSSQSGKDIVNDLDLRLIDPNNRTYLPLVLNSSAPNEIAKPGIDSNNNVEMAIGNASGTAGNWQVVVDGGQINNTPQSFSLIVSELRPTTVVVTPPNPTITFGSSIHLHALVKDIDTKGPTRTPVGWVYFSDGQGGSFENENCDVRDRLLVCDVTYLPSSSSPSNYQIFAKYLGDGDHGGSSGTANISISSTPPSVSITSISYNVICTTMGSQGIIPGWIKNTAGWWHDGTVDDSTFIGSLQYMIKCGIMNVPTTAFVGSQTVIPSWVKNTAGWWHDGNVTDSTFVGAIQYMIQMGFMKIPSPQIGVGISQVLLNATVADNSGTVTPTGTVLWSDNASGTFTTDTCDISAVGGCSIGYNSSGTSVGISITAEYSGDNTHSGSGKTISFSIIP